MRYVIRTTSDISDAKKYFMKWHDAFLTQLAVEMTYAGGLPSWGGRLECTVVLLLYQDRAALHDDVRPSWIRMRLGGVTMLRVGDILPVDDMLQECLVEIADDGSITLDVGGDGLVVFNCAHLEIEEGGDRGVEKVDA